MGNGLSPYVAEAYMCKFESDLKKEGKLPRIWHRYVDDTFAVVKKSEADKILATINNRFHSIKFTFEKEDDTLHTLPFLDLEIKRKGKNVEFSVYRKPTSTDRYITNDSYCAYNQKIAAFHSMVYRLCRLPLSVESYMKEYQQILHIADVNGYDKLVIDHLIKKHSKKLKLSNISTLFDQNTSSNKHRVTLPFTPNITNKLIHVFAKSEMSIVHTNNNKLKSILGSTKDNIPTNRCSGIYQISCSNCNKKYIGQTRRAAEVRFNEHHRSVKKKEIDKAIAAHIFDPNNDSPHKITSFDDNFKLLKKVNKPNKLDAYESIHIYINNNLMNLEPGPIDSKLFSAIKKENR
ncbi:uncharacterized protein LOC129953577 [Eupeodes corollae]|uniref:uncharacterized protein LOC129953510 n=1 Tax=Eupeodes corollae TaxID=290404 RepID=UPI002492DEFE|nr:uncharacterized protein LOC129953510 [Eupeodes corollae]XP_055922728.1 uncharacterized protein LOC129953511 [Eupeodes corollae]XP_055922795.1 uncharacterized protein LOC129953577 [Eupeodes corollae]